MPSNWYHQVEVRILSPLKLCVNTYPISHNLLQLRGFSLLRFTAIAIFWEPSLLRSRQWGFVRETPRGPRLNSHRKHNLTQSGVSRRGVFAYTLHVCPKFEPLLEATMHESFAFLLSYLCNFPTPFRSPNSCRLDPSYCCAPYTCACQNVGSLVNAFVSLFFDIFAVVYVLVWFLFPFVLYSLLTLL